MGHHQRPLPLLHNFTGVLIGMVHVLLPYMVLPIYGAVRGSIRPSSPPPQGLGASNWRIFWRIYIPLTLNGIFAGSCWSSCCRSASSSRRRCWAAAG